MSDEDGAPPTRHFQWSFLYTWPALFKGTETVLCALCFLCNELLWYPLTPYPARTFLSVCSCLALISSILLFLVLGCGVDRYFTNTTWWRIVVVALPAICALFLMMSSAAQTNIGGFVSAGFQAAAVFGFLAFSTYLADAMYHFTRLRQAGELPSLGGLAGKGPQFRSARGDGPAPTDGSDKNLRAPGSWNVPLDSANRQSPDSDEGTSGKYSLQ
ncbi:uncharacterized protein LOC119089759 [Pollicipes pollicipes]|uniref:uncharacterized protein LOC119089759 n=1 Tax=Pollicipes pollicipes TaxID=41117 RepID=UPI001885680C|nr:uncharacterized protein LOC119089759 [Pollicipes pollicipes]